VGGAGRRSGGAQHPRRRYSVAASGLAESDRGAGTGRIRLSAFRGNRPVPGWPQAKARDAVHVVFAAEKMRNEYQLPAPDVDEAEQIERFNVLKLEALVRMKLTSFRDRHRMHLRDLLDVELIDQSWCDRFPAELAARLQELIDNPDG
jgi:hypothetical protein